MSDLDEAQRILAAYCALEDTALIRPSRADRALANNLVARGLSFDLLEAAFILATARRRLPSTSSQPIRSLAYFIPIIDELLSDPPDPDYIHHLAARLNGPKNCGSS
jgi:hypothetical protein